MAVASYILVLLVAGVVQIEGAEHLFNTFCLNGDTCGTNGIACTATTTQCTGVACACNLGYNGRSDCSGEPICTSGGSQCGSNGACDVTTPSSPQCACNNGYYGLRCQNAPICTASGGQCGTHGKCITCGTDPNRNFYCQCLNGWAGNRCEKPPICSKHADCGNHGGCSYAQNPYICKCLHGWGGDRCQLPPHCTPNGFECGTRGTCNIVNFERSICSCNTGLMGPLCGSATKLALTSTSLVVMVICAMLF